ncbi:MAG: hypothetical protein ACI8TF_002582 [Paracoccaceae bacterium]|jgi:hypothetical protein
MYRFSLISAALTAVTLLATTLHAGAFDSLPFVAQSAFGDTGVLVPANR